jgi:dihydroceramide fatty acyl 2-hydroxylase
MAVLPLALGLVGRLAAGAALWSLAEYVLHRADMHGRAGRGATSREHLGHHARLDVPALTPGTWVGAAIVALALAAGGHTVTGVGWMAAYVAYELVHRAIHAGDGGGRYRRWARAHHLHHHLVDARTNYGVTSPLWDLTFRTHHRRGPRARTLAEMSESERERRWWRLLDRRALVRDQVAATDEEIERDVSDTVKHVPKERSSRRR